MQGPSSARRPRALLLMLLLVAAGFAGACMEQGATPGASVAPGSTTPAASGVDGGLPSGEACSIATACPSPTQ